MVDGRVLAKKMGAGEKKFSLSAVITQPDITTDRLKASIFADTLGEFATNYAQSSANRIKNITLAAGKINGVIIPAGGIFSFNKTVGERTYNNGFTDANVYVGGKVEQGVGGGICQVSSTLYCAQLYADLQTVSRSNHMFTVSYLPLGQDATVVWNAVDYSFKNNTDYPVKLAASAQGGILTMKVLGTKPDKNLKIKIINTVISTTPAKEKIEYTDEISPGQKKIEQAGQKGAVVDTYKVYMRNGIEEKRVFLHRSSYMPMERLIFVGKNIAAENKQQTNGNNALEDDISENENPAEEKPDTQAHEKEEKDNVQGQVSEEFLSDTGL